MIEGLRKAGIKCTIDVNTFRKNVYDYVSKNQNTVLPQLLFSGKRMTSGAKRGMTRDTFIKTKVLDTIWNNKENFNGRVDECYWVHSAIHLPIFAEMFAANFIWFDVDNCKTRGYVKLQTRNQRHGKLHVLVKSGYVSPSLLLKDSIWTKTVVMLYYASHYQHAVE